MRVLLLLVFVVAFGWGLEKEVSLEQLVIQLMEKLSELAEDVTAIKMSISETEIDLQSTRNAVDSVREWTTSADGKFRQLEKTFCRRKRGRKKKKMMMNTDDVQADDSAAPLLLFEEQKENCCGVKTQIQQLQQQCASRGRNRRASSCAEIQQNWDWSLKELKSGPQAVNPAIYGFDSYLNVFCDFQTDGGGWTLFQRRDDFGLPRENFQRNWSEYKSGFGDISRELWLGNDAIYALSNQEPVELRIELENFEGQVRYAQYSLFRVTDENDNYRIQLGPYSGDAADSLSRSQGMTFSTKDLDTDKWSGNCALRFGGGWWFNNCHDANLNGLYYGGEHESYGDGVNWYHWTGFHYSLKRSEMKMRPLWFSEKKHSDEN